MNEKNNRIIKLDEGPNLLSRAKSATLAGLCLGFAVTNVFAASPSVTAEASEAPAKENMLVDGGFEEVRNGSLVEWRENTSPGYTFESLEVIEGDPRHVRSGNNSVKFVQTEQLSPGEPKFGQLLGVQSTPIVPVTEYALTFWAKGEGKVGVAVYPLTGDGNNKQMPGSIASVTREDSLPGESYDITNPDEWQQFTFRFVLTQEHTGIESIRFGLGVHGTVYVDDYSVSEMP